ncbi:putative uncharacterized protein [Corynebacterium casei UCMA 3821]|uniref:Uncharacterized protein n=1 Tax=Corynebacterium casei UCMA 3821 TaxID=1110505 RepID=G7HYN6_9CORY|nr:putative uncharacterized protein [Corynebacterium casei UCMA 3821]
MSQPPAIQISDLSGRPSLDVIIRSDLKTPNRIYCQFPAYASLSHDEAIAIASRLADLIEGQLA